MPKTRNFQQDKPAIVKYRVFGLQASLHRVNGDEAKTSAMIYQIGEGEEASEIYSDTPVTITVDHAKNKKGRAYISSRLALHGILVTAICREEISYKQTGKEQILDGFALSELERYQPRYLQLLENGSMVHYDRATHIFDRPRAHEGQHLDRSENGIFVLQPAA